MFIPIGLSVIIFLNILMMFRNFSVHDERVRVLNCIGEKCREDFINGKDWLWRFDSFSSISHEEMLFKFWKPVKSFYKEHECLK